MSTTSHSIPLTTVKQREPSLPFSNYKFNQGIASKGYEQKIGPPKNRRQHRGVLFAQIAGGLVAVLGALTLAGWWLNIDALKVIVPGAAPLKPNAAAGFLLSGIALMLLSRRNVMTLHRVSAIVAGLCVTLLGVLTLGEHLLNWDLGIDNFLFSSARPAIDALRPGRMHPVSAFGFAIIGLALLTETLLTSPRFRVPLAAGLSATVALLGFMPLLGFILEIIAGPRWNFMGMSLSGVVGAVSFQLLGAGLLGLLGGKGELEWSLDAITSAGFVVGILLTALTTASGFNFARRMLETNTWVAHRQEVLKELESAKNGAAELLNSERLYVILGNEDLLKDRHETKNVMAKNLATIRKLVADNLNQENRLGEMESLMKQRIAWAEGVIATRRTQGSTAASEMIATGTGIRLAERIGGRSREMEAEEHRLLKNDQDALQKAAIGTFLVLPMGVFISAGVLSLAVFFLNTGVGERMKSGLALRESEARMRAVLESALDCVIAMDHEGRVMEFNPAAEKTFGYRRDEAIGQSLADLVIPPSLRDQHRRGLSHYLVTGEAPVLGKRLELPAIRRDGSEFPVELSITRIGDQHPPMFTGFIRDITDRKCAEEKLQSSETRYRKLFESNPNPMWVYDVETLAFLAVNDAAVGHYGYSEAEFLAMTIKDIRPAEDIPSLLADVSSSATSLGKVSEWRHQLKDGRLIDVEIASHELEWLGRSARLVLVNDVTERKRADEVRARLVAIIESSEDAIISKTLEGIITSWNRGAEKLFGYSAEEAVGQPMLVVFPPERIGEESEILWRIRQGESVNHFETVRVTKSGKPIDVSVTHSPIRNKEGQIIGASKIARDISGRKRAEEKIRQLNAELEERVKQRTAELEMANKELEAFSYSVSHDLRAPLRAVDGFSLALLEDYGRKMPAEGRRYLETIRHGAQRMGALIDDLLSFSRLSRKPLGKQTVDTEQVVQEALADLRDQQQDRQLELRIGDLPPCYGDPALLKQVWVNLVSNALKYTRKRDTAKVEIGSTSENGETVYFISDNGTGFDMQYAHKLFGVFQRLHRAEEFEGTGVGLATVQRIVHRHGGRIWAEAEPDRGAKFCFTLQDSNTDKV